MKFSIITPSFNQGEFIERTIQSVISQNYGCEYIVIDGGSVDQTLGVLKQYENKLYWKSERDKGQGHAVNKGLQMISGDIIGWLNSDDVYYPGVLEKISQFFASHPDVDVIYGDSYLIDGDDKKIGFYPTEPWSLNRLKKRCFLSQPATFFRRRIIEQYGLLIESLQFCMDYEFWLRLGLGGARFVYFPHVLAGSRVHHQTKSVRYCLEASIEANNVLNKKLGYLPRERLVSYSIATVKARYSLPSSSLKFIFAIWLNLWAATGVYYKGSSRILAWLGAHQAMLKEFYKRGRVTSQKKNRYS